jgi:hypothetical protein
MDSVERRAVSFARHGAERILVLPLFFVVGGSRSGCRPGSAALLSLTSKAAEPPLRCGGHAQFMERHEVIRRLILGLDNGGRRSSCSTLTNC